MKNKFVSLLIFILIVLSISFCSCVGIVAKSITIESGEIPPDMKEEEFIIIGVLQTRNSYDRYLKKAFKNYPGNYILATQSEIDSKYSDVDKYRYIMDYNIKSSTIKRTETKYNPNPLPHQKSYESKEVSTTTTSYLYSIYDRKEEVLYSRKRTSSSFAMEMRAYVIAISAVMLKPDNSDL